MQAYKVIEDFEKALSEYTGAPYVTCVNSCTMAIRLCLDYMQSRNNCQPLMLEIPKHTYVSVPIQIKQAGYKVGFREEDWQGMYKIQPYPIFDSARRFHAGMCVKTYDDDDDEQGVYYQCVSFHWTKILGLGHGGAILHNNNSARAFFRQMRFDGRVDGEPIQNEYITKLGHHCPMMPEIAAQGLVRLSNLPAYNPDLPLSNYPDLSRFEIFK